MSIDITKIISSSTPINQKEENKNIANEIAKKKAALEVNPTQIAKTSNFIETIAKKDNQTVLELDPNMEQFALIGELASNKEIEVYNEAGLFVNDILELVKYNINKLIFYLSKHFETSGDQSTTSSSSGGPQLDTDLAAMSKKNTLLMKISLFLNNLQATQKATTETLNRISVIQGNEFKQSQNKQLMQNRMQRLEQENKQIMQQQNTQMLNQKLTK